MTDATASSAQPPSRFGERRARRIGRGHLALFWNLVFGALRKLGTHGRERSTPRSASSSSSASLVAVAGTLGFAELGEIVREGYTQQFDTAVLRWIGRAPLADCSPRS